MTEETRERRYFLLALGFLALAAPTFVVLARADVQPRLVRGFEVLLVGIAGVLLSILMELVLGGFRRGSWPRFWVVHPTARSRHALTAGDEAWRSDLAARLRRLGFEGDVSALAASAPAALVKHARHPIQGFLDHAFGATLTVQPGADGDELVADVTFQDTITVETGETKVLQALADHLALERADFAPRSVPLTIICALNLSFVSVLLSWAVARGAFDVRWYFAAAFLAFTMPIVALLFGMRDRARALGLRLAALSMVLSTVAVAAFV